jgi:5-dehydro-2-deoxygluconokinase
MHPDDPADLTARQDRELLRLYDAARKGNHELLIEIIAGKHGPLDDDTVASVIARLYALGIKPDWWKLEGQPSAKAWANVAATIRAHDPFARGIMLLGLDAPEEELLAAFHLAGACDLVKGFAVGRTIFGEPARAWLAGQIDDAEVKHQMAARFRRLVDAWLSIRPH